MTLLYDLGLRESSGPLWRARIFVVACLAAFKRLDDLRWTVLALALRALGTAGAFGQRQPFPVGSARAAPGLAGSPFRRRSHRC